MTVQELIDKLKECEPSAEVTISIESVWRGKFAYENFVPEISYASFEYVEIIPGKQTR